MLKAVKEEQYVITIGDELCDSVSVTMNEITCKPPRSEPTDNTSDYVSVTVSKLFRRGETSISLLVSICHGNLYIYK